jgi:cobalt-zinc-cadmium efflux system outer membrane protein
MRSWRLITPLISCILAGCQLPGTPPWSDESQQAETPVLPPQMAPAGDVQNASYEQPADEPLINAPLTPPTNTAAPPELIPAPPADVLQELTLPDLEEIALTSNPTLAEAWAKVEAARGRWLQGGLPPNVIVGYSGQQLGSGGEAEQNGVYIEQEFVRLRKLRWNQAVASGEMEVAQQQWQAQQQRVLTDVRLGYYEVLVAQRRLEISQRLAEIARASLQTTNDLFRVEEVSEADVLRATIELQTAELALRTSTNAYAGAWGRLAAVLGGPDFPCRPLAGDLASDIPLIELHATLDRLLAASPELSAAMVDVERARSAVVRAEVEWLPDVNVQGVIQQDNATDSSNGNLQVSLPIPYLNRNQGGVREARANLVAAQQAVGRVQLRLQQRLATVYQRYANARNEVDAYSQPKGILENARRTLELIGIAYEAGQLSYVDLLTAQRTNAQTNLAYVEALGELWSAASEIDGLLLRDSLQTGEAAPASLASRDSK